MQTTPKKSETYITKRPETTRNGAVRVVGERSISTFELRDCDPDEILHFIANIVSRGDLVSFTKTSDGGALCITILCGDKRIKGYARSEAELYVRMNDMKEVCYA